MNKPALTDDFLDAEIRRTAPDYIVYRPHAEEGFDDHGNEHFHVFHVRDALCALWTMSAYEGTFTQRPAFAVSRDGGKSWTEPKCILREPIDKTTGRNMGSWAAAAVSRSGRIYIFYSKHVGGGTDHETGRMYVLYSDDIGESWSREVPFEMPYDPEYDVVAADKPLSLFPWQNALRLSDGTHIFGLSHNWKNPKWNPEPRKYWPRMQGGCEFMRIFNLDDDPEPAQLKVSFYARNEKGLNGPMRGDSFRRSGEEPAVVELPDGRLFCAFRCVEGHVWYSVSEDRGATWRECEMLRYRDGGEGILHPYSPSPLFSIGNGAFLLFTHNHDGMAEDGITPKTDCNWRNPLFMLKGRYVAGAHQPIWFDAPVEIMNNGDVAMRRKDLAIYGDMTVEEGTPVLWYPDRKFFLLGKKLPL